MEFAIDTNVFLNVKNREEPYYAYSKSILDSVDGGRNKAFVSTVVIAEICSGYYLTREIDEKEEFLLHLLSSQNYEVVEDILRPWDLNAISGGSGGMSHVPSVAGPRVSRRS